MTRCESLCQNWHGAVRGAVPNSLEVRQAALDRGVRCGLSGRLRLRRALGAKAVAVRLRLPALRFAEGLAIGSAALDLGMRRERERQVLSSPDLRAGRHHPARHAPAAEEVVPGRLPGDDPFQRDICAATPVETRPGLVQVGLASAAQAASRHGQPASHAAVGRGRGRRDKHPVPDER